MSDLNKYIILADEYSKKKEHEKSIEYLEKALDLKPNFSTGWVMMGQQYEHLSKIKKALECYEKALDINPEDTDAKWYKEELLKRGRVGVPEDVKKSSELMNGTMKSTPKDKNKKQLSHEMIISDDNLWLVSNIIFGIFFAIGLYTFISGAYSLSDIITTLLIAGIVPIIGFSLSLLIKLYVWSRNRKFLKQNPRPQRDFFLNICCLSFWIFIFVAFLSMAL